MKKILTLYFLAFSFLFLSCVEQNSTKGSWSSSDIQKCKQEGLDDNNNVTGKVRENAEEYYALAGTSLEEHVTCYCEKMEKNYDSYSIAREKMYPGDGELISAEIISILSSCLHLFNQEKSSK
ncbi:MAG: hypothetical protein VX762_05405 [Bacteroidota bacterium]|nr:hypothetical protein [Bacteroidota bacterium]